MINKNNAAKIRRHPQALPYLFLTEMWERFGFYVVQGLLVLYMTGFYSFSDSKSYTISGLFSGLVYISPFLGGFIADRFLGFAAAILWGGFFLCAGYALLALTNTEALFYLSLAIIIVGNGLFKPNISSLLGSQYHRDDPRRDAGFTIFYVGINIGSALSGISGYFRNAFGWQAPFALASIGMGIALITFLLSIKKIKFDVRERDFRLKDNALFVLGTLFTLFCLSKLLANDLLATWLMPFVGIGLLIYLFIVWLQQNTLDRQRLLLLNLLILSSILFWALFLQLFTSANLYVDRLVDKNLFGLTLSTTVFYASEGLFIVILGPLFAFLWHILGNYHYNPSPVNKFVLGLIFTACSFLLLSISALNPSENGLINPLWVFGSYFLLTIGELLLSPTGLSATTLLAPKKLAGMMMGVWFVATGFGGIAAGMLAKIASIPNDTVSSSEKLQIYHAAFLDYAYIAFAIGILLIIIHWALQNTLRHFEKKKLKAK